MDARPAIPDGEMASVNEPAPGPRPHRCNARVEDFLQACSSRGTPAYTGAADASTSGESAEPHCHAFPARRPCSPASSPARSCRHGAPCAAALRLNLGAYQSMLKSPGCTALAWSPGSKLLRVGCSNHIYACVSSIASPLPSAPSLLHLLRWTRASMHAATVTASTLPAPDPDIAPPAAQSGADGSVSGVDGPGEVPAAHVEATRAASAASAAMTASSRSRA